jgi:hypothetical protein
MYTMCELWNEVLLTPSCEYAAVKKGYFVKHGMDNVLLRVKRVRVPSGPETKQDLLAHVDICRGQVVDIVNDE